MHFLYVAIGATYVKVGITSKPKARGAAISAQFRKRGDALSRFVVMPGMPAGYGVEASICNRFAPVADRVDGREWFVGIDADEVIAATREAVMNARRFQLRSKYFKQATARKAKTTATA